MCSTTARIWLPAQYGLAKSQHSTQHTPQLCTAMEHAPGTLRQSQGSPASYNDMACVRTVAHTFTGTLREAASHRGH
jgi:hypothetical protein